MSLLQSKADKAWKVLKTHLYLLFMKVKVFVAVRVLCSDSGGINQSSFPVVFPLTRLFFIVSGHVFPLSPLKAVICCCPLTDNLFNSVSCVDLHFSFEVWPQGLSPNLRSAAAISNRALQ